MAAAPQTEEVVKKLEEMGYRIGESMVERISRDTPRFKNELDAVVFICKIFWVHAFNKQIDNLKTNHQVLTTIHVVNMVMGMVVVGEGMVVVVVL